MQLLLMVHFVVFALGEGTENHVCAVKRAIVPFVVNMQNTPAQIVLKLVKEKMIDLSTGLFLCYLKRYFAECLLFLVDLNLDLLLFFVVIFFVYIICLNFCSGQVLLCQYSQ